MSDIVEVLKEVNEQILALDVVQEFFRLKRLVEEDDDLKELDKEVRLHQKLMCQAKNNDELYFREKAIFEDLQNKLDNNPLYANFIEVKNEVNTLLVDIRDFLS